MRSEAPPPLTDAERIAADLFAPECIHPAGEACTECEARARTFVAAIAPAILAACPDCATSEAELLGVAAVVNVVRYGHSPFAVPMLEKDSLSWQVAEAISRGRHRGLAGQPDTRPDIDPAEIQAAVDAAYGATMTRIGRAPDDDAEKGLEGA